MKISLGDLRKLIAESTLLSEATCPLCGDKSAYVGLNSIECSTPTCRNFHKTLSDKQRTELMARAAFDDMGNENVQRRWDRLWNEPRSVVFMQPAFDGLMFAFPDDKIESLQDAVERELIAAGNSSDYAQGIVENLWDEPVGKQTAYKWLSKRMQQTSAKWIYDSETRELFDFAEFSAT